MKDLVVNIETFLKADITSGDINVDDIEDNHVTRGLASEEAIIQMPTTKYPFIMIGDGGERTEETNSSDTMMRIYSVIIDFATYETNIQNSFDDLLDLSSQIETSIKAEKNRQSLWTSPDGDDNFDDIIWGTNILPYFWDADRYFFHGRRVTVDYKKLEFTYARF